MVPNGAQASCLHGRTAPPQSGGQRRQNPGGAFWKLAAFAGPDGPGPAQAVGGHARAPAARGTRRKIEKLAVEFPVLREFAGLHARGVSRKSPAMTPAKWLNTSGTRSGPA